MPTKIKIKPILAVLCDDVRQENNGKPFILGLYQAGITLNLNDMAVFGKSPLIPKPLLKLALWLVYEADDAGIASVEIEIISPNPQRKITAQIDIALEKKPPPYEVLTITLPGLLIPLEQEGNITIQFRHAGDSDWKILRTVPVTIIPAPEVTSNPSGTLPPS